MKALVYEGPETQVMRDWEMPEPGEGEVRLKIKYVGICGSDVHGYLGTTGRRTAPMVQGHEFSAYIDKLGDGVEGWKEGDRVTVQPIYNCGVCDYCKRGFENICANRIFLGTMSCNGALQEYLCVPAKNLVMLPENITMEVGALIEPFAVGYRSVTHALPLEGKNVMICGAGTIGLMVLKAAKIFNPAKVVMVDLSDERLELAKKHGADIVINGKSDIDAALREAGIRDCVDVVFEAVGATPTVQQSVNFVKNQGQVVWVGNAAPMVTLNMQMVVTREVNIQGNYVYTDKDFRDCVKILSEHPQDFTGIITDIVPFDEANNYFDILAKGPGAKIKVLVDVTK